MKDKVSTIILISYRERILIFWHESIIGIFQGGGVNFITKASFTIKQEAIYELKENKYLSKELAEFLLDKYCYHEAKKAPAIGDGRTGYLHIHPERYKDKVLVFQNNYSRLLAVFQKNNLDLMDEDAMYLNTKKKIIEQLKYYRYINNNQANELLKNMVNCQ